MSDRLERKSRVTIHRETKAYNVKRSDLVPLERGRCMNGFLPQAPLVRTLGAEESYICICMHKRCQRAGERDFII